MSTPAAIWKKYAVYRSAGGKTVRTTLWSTNTPDVNCNAWARTPTIGRFTDPPAKSEARIWSPGARRSRASSGAKWVGAAAGRAAVGHLGLVRPERPGRI